MPQIVDLTALRDVVRLRLAVCDFHIEPKLFSYEPLVMHLVSWAYH